jgi:hypothetical protein
MVFRGWQNAVEASGSQHWPQPNPLDAVVQRYQGGGFVSIDCTPENRRSAGLHGQ